MGTEPTRVVDVGVEIGLCRCAIGNLHIDGVQKFDAGTYLCKASNGVGQPQSKVISVEVFG